MPNPIENIAAKGAGLVGGLQARTQGLKGVFVTLAEQHHEAATLLSRAHGTEDAGKRRDLWSEIKKQLVSHERGELAEVYPAIAARPGTTDIVQRHAEEANQLETAINKLDGMSFEGQSWKAAIEHLTALVKQHVEEEEHDFFPRAQEALGDDGAKRLEGPFLAAKQREMNNIH